MFEHIINTVMRLYQMDYNKQWDLKLNELLDNIKSLEDVTLENHTVLIGSYEIWISNKYYSYGYARSIGDRFVPEYLEFRPKFSTMKRLDKLVSNLKEQEVKKGIEKLYGKG